MSGPTNDVALWDADTTDAAQKAFTANFLRIGGVRRGTQSAFQFALYNDKQTNPTPGGQYQFARDTEIDSAGNVLLDGSFRFSTNAVLLGFRRR